MREQIKRILIIGTMFILIPVLSVAQAEEHHVHKHLALILIPGFSFPDLPPLLEALPLPLKEQLRYAGMTLRTGAGVNLVNNVLTLSTGQRETGMKNWNAYHRGEQLEEGRSAEDTYRQGRGVQPTSDIIHPAIYQLKSRQKGDSLLQPGWLGDYLHQKQIHLLALGNSDTAEQKQRIAPTLIMNQEGEAEGVVSLESLLTHPYFPGGLSTNWSFLSTQLEEKWRGAGSSFSVIEIGDIHRLLQYKGEMDPDYYKKLRTSWDQEFALWFEDVTQQAASLEKEIELWILSPMVSEEASRQGKLLAPYLIWNQEGEAGLLSSATTRQQGLISNLDIVPSILSFFDLKGPDQLLGQEVFISQREKEAAAYHSHAQVEGFVSSWLSEVNYIFDIYQKRRDIITAYLIILILCLIIMTGYWLFDKKKRRAKIVQVLNGAILLSPLYFLWLTPFIQWFHEWVWISILFSFSLLTGLLLHRIFASTLFLCMIGFINSIAILYDIWQGSLWMKRSFLGYDPLIGARYYGLGNEYAGILLGSSLLAVAALYVWLLRNRTGEKEVAYKRKWVLFSSVYYLFIVYTISAPHLGTNLGASLASLVTYVLVILIHSHIRLTKKNLLLLSMGAAAILLLVLSLHMRGEHTHIGTFIHKLVAGDAGYVSEIIFRKLSMNLKLIRVSLWGKLFVTSLIVLAIILFGIKKDHSFRKRNDRWFYSFRAMIVGAILILAVNDSGIVAAATMMIYVTLPSIYLRFEPLSKG